MVSELGNPVPEGPTPAMLVSKDVGGYRIFRGDRVFPNDSTERKGLKTQIALHLSFGGDNGPVVLEVQRFEK